MANTWKDKWKMPTHATKTWTCVCASGDLGENKNKLEHKTYHKNNNYEKNDKTVQRKVKLK